MSRYSPLKLQCSYSKSLVEMPCTLSHSWEQEGLFRSNSDCRNIVITCRAWVRINSAYTAMSLKSIFYFLCHATEVRNYLWKLNIYSLPTIITFDMYSYALMIYSSGLHCMEVSLAHSDAFRKDCTHRHTLLSTDFAH